MFDLRRSARVQRGKKTRADTLGMLVTAIQRTTRQGRLALTCSPLIGAYLLSVYYIVTKYKAQIDSAVDGQPRRIITTV